MGGRGAFVGGWVWRWKWPSLVRIWIFWVQIYHFIKWVVGLGESNENVVLELSGEIYCHILTNIFFIDFDTFSRKTFISRLKN